MTCQYLDRIFSWIGHVKYHMQSTQAKTSKCFFFLLKIDRLIIVDLALFLTIGHT